MVKVERWKRRLRAIGFIGSIEPWPDWGGSDLSIEAIPDDCKLEAVQVIFEQNNNKPAQELLQDFGVCLRGVYEQCQEQVLNCQPH